MKTCVEFVPWCVGQSWPIDRHKIDYIHSVYLYIYVLINTTTWAASTLTNWWFRGGLLSLNHRSSSLNITTQSAEHSDAVREVKETSAPIEVFYRQTHVYRLRSLGANRPPYYWTLRKAVQDIQQTLITLGLRVCLDRDHHTRDNNLTILPSCGFGEINLVLICRLSGSLRTHLRIAYSRHKLSLLACI